MVRADIQKFSNSVFHIVLSIDRIEESARLIYARKNHGNKLHFFSLVIYIIIYSE
jgi:hypothetical protein